MRVLVMWVCTAEASGEAWARPRAAADSFVVAEAVVSKERVVHRALAAGAEAERLEQGVDDSLAGLHVSTGDGGTQLRVRREVGVQHSGGNSQIDRREQPFIQRQGSPRS
jgi:hypothetical protein